MAKGGEVLSQSQIDSLLSAINSGNTSVQSIKEKETTKEQFRNYDFKHPAKFSRDHTQTIYAIHEGYARLFSTQLSTQMRLAVQIDVVSVDQLTYDEFMRSITNPTVVMIFQMNPLEGSALLEFTPSTAISIIDRLLGGPGRAVGRARELTDIEQNLISSVVKKGMLALRESWKNIIPDLDPNINSTETNPRFVQIVAPTDTVVVVSFEIKIGESQGSMRLCLPYPTIEPVISRMSTQYFIATAGRRGDLEKTAVEVKRNMSNVEVRLALLLGYTDITVRDLVSLQIGDVISLDSQISQELPITVEQSCKFYGRPGTIGNKMAAQITSIVEEGI